MAVPDGFFYEGFDKYGEAGVSSLTTLLIMGEWTSTAQNGSGSWATVAPLSGDGAGQAMRMTLSNNPSGRSISMVKILDGNYERIVGGVTFKWVSVSTAQPYGICYRDGSTSQFAVTIDPSGTISLRRGDDDGTIIATSTEAPGIGTTNTLTWDIVCHGSTATATVYLNGVACTNINGLTGLDLTNTANNYFNQIEIRCDHGGTAGGTTIIDLDHFWNHFYSSSATSYDALPLTSNPVIDTDFPATDVTTNFTPTSGALGDLTRYGANVATPAAGSLILRKFTAVGDGTLSSMKLTPNATNAGAKFKGVIYADNGSGTAPAAQLGVGTEVVGCTTGVTLSSTMNNEALVGGTIYWIGFIMDTSLSLQLRDATAVGYRAANTYASGAPDPAPAMTSGQGSWYTFGIIVPSENFSQLRQSPQDASSINVGDTVAERDMFGFDPLTVNPAQIHGAAVKVNLRRTDAGARTVSVLIDSNGSEIASTPAAPSTSGTWIAGYSAIDPDTGLAWTSTKINAVNGGYEIES